MKQRQAKQSEAKQNKIPTVSVATASAAVSSGNMGNYVCARWQMKGKTEKNKLHDNRNVMKLKIGSFVTLCN